MYRSDHEKVPLHIFNEKKIQMTVLSEESRWVGILINPENKKKILTTHCDTIVWTIMITQIPIENIRNISNNTLCTCIILTYQSSSKYFILFYFIFHSRNIILTRTGNPFIVIHNVHFTRWVMVTQEPTWLQTGISIKT